FGSAKQSGLGREGSAEGREEFLEEKYIGSALGVVGTSVPRLLTGRAAPARWLIHRCSPGAHTNRLALDHRSAAVPDTTTAFGRGDGAEDDGRLIGAVGPPVRGLAVVVGGVARVELVAAFAVDDEQASGDDGDGLGG